MTELSDTADCADAACSIVHYAGNQLPADSTRRVSGLNYLRADSLCFYVVIRSCLPSARIMRMTVENDGLPCSDSAL